jgi:hypothetical protein
MWCIRPMVTRSSPPGYLASKDTSKRGATTAPRGNARGHGGAQAVYADPAAKAVYVAAARQLSRPPFRLAVSDFLRGRPRVTLPSPASEGTTSGPSSMPGSAQQEAADDYFAAPAAIIFSKPPSRQTFSVWLSSQPAILPRMRTDGNACPSDFQRAISISSGNARARKVGRSAVALDFDIPSRRNAWGRRSIDKKEASDRDRQPPAPVQWVEYFSGAPRRPHHAEKR